MASKSSEQQEENHENPNHPPQIDTVPGGKLVELPSEPEPPQEKEKDEPMGPCTSANKLDREDKKAKKKGSTKAANAPRSSSLEPSSSRSEPGAKKMKTEVEPVKSRSPSPRVVQPKTFDDDDDEENENKGYRTKPGPVTRSRVAYSPISITFEDSDHEDNQISSWAKRDIEDYRQGYPGLRQNTKSNTNVKFYTNVIPSHPNGDYIDEIHKKWRGDYRKLEFHHGFIQWLFPLQEEGLNWSADPLQKHEIERIKTDPEAMERLHRSYEMMLDFYGFELKDRQTGEVIRTTTGDWRERFYNLNTSSHNYLRITRILKCLGEFDLEHYKYPFLHALLREAITENTIPKCLRSCRDYWIETLKDPRERKAIRQFARDLLDYRRRNVQPPDSVLQLNTAKKRTSGKRQIPRMPENYESTNV